MLQIVDEGWQSFVFLNCLYREKFLPTFCLSMMMFLLLCFIWSQKKSLTQTGENLLCFTFKLWLLSASDSASINLCCLREIVSTSLTFRFQQLEYQVFPFKSLFWRCTCSRNKKLVHWKPSPACCLWTFPECSGPQEKGCWDFNLSNIQTVRFISMKFLLEIFPSFSWLNFCKIFPSRVRFLVVSLRLHLRLFLVLPQNFLSHTSPKHHPTPKIPRNPLSLTLWVIFLSLFQIFMQSLFPAAC